MRNGIWVTALLTLAAPAAATAQTPAKTETGFTVFDKAPAAVADIFAEYSKTFGFVPNLAKVMANSPALLHTYKDAQANLQKYGKLSPAELNVVQMTIAVENKCRYCTAGHTMVGKMMYKTPDAEMMCIRNGKPVTDPKLRSLQTFAKQVYDGRGRVEPAQLKAFLAAGYTRAQALDVVACIAAKVMTNYTNALAETELDEPLKPLAEGLKFKE